MRQLLAGRLLEGVDAHAGRVGAAQDVLDGAVLAGGVDALEHDEQRALLLRVQPLLQAGDLLAQPARTRARPRPRAEAAGVRGVVLGEREALARLDPVAREVGELRRRDVHAGALPRVRSAHACRDRARRRSLEPHGHAEGVAGLARDDAAAAGLRDRRARRRRARWSSCARPGRSCPPLPGGVRVVEDAREGRGPLQGILAGLEAADADVAFVASVDLPFLHPRFVAAVCAAAAGRRRRRAARRRLPPAARGGLPAVARAAGGGARRGRPDEAGVPVRALRTRWLEALPHPESVRNLNARADYEAALAEPGRCVRVRGFGPLRRPRTEVRAATLGGAGGRVRRGAGRARARGPQRRPGRARPARAAGRGRRGGVHGRRRGRMTRPRAGRAARPRRGRDRARAARRRGRRSRATRPTS